MTRAELLRDTRLRALLVAEIVSTTGAQMTWLALPWFVLTTSGSASRMGVVMGAELIGLAAFGIPAGMILGRLGGRRTMLLADALRAPLMLLVPILHWTGHLSLWALLALAFSLGALAGPYFAARAIMVPELLGEDERVVGQANALFQGAIRTTMLLGPPLAGVLIAWIGAPSVLLVDAATYVVSFLLVLIWVPQRPPTPQTEDARGVLTGVKTIFREPLLRFWTPLFVIGDTAWQALFAAVPVLVVASYGGDPRIAGLLFASFGIGAVIGNVIVFRYLAERVEPLRLIAAVVMAQALPLWVLAFETPAWVAAAAVVVSGVGNGLCNPSIHSLMTLRIAPQLRPKAMTAQMVIYGIVTPLGVLVGGPILDAVGAHPVLAGVAAIQTFAMAGVALASLHAAQTTPPLQAEPTGA
jgi:predicted MFS family arabinose efflux permease